MSSVGRLLSLFHANYKVKYNHCVDFIRCLDGALISSEVNTLNSSGSDPCKNVDRGTTANTVDIYQIKHRGKHCCLSLVVMRKTQGVTLAFLSNETWGVTLSFFIGLHEKKHKGSGAFLGFWNIRGLAQEGIGQCACGKFCCILYCACIFFHNALPK